MHRHAGVVRHRDAHARGRTAVHDSGGGEARAYEKRRRPHRAECDAEKDTASFSEGKRFAADAHALCARGDASPGKVGRSNFSAGKESRATARRIDRRSRQPQQQRRSRSHCRHGGFASAQALIRHHLPRDLCGLHVARIGSVVDSSRARPPPESSADSSGKPGAEIERRTGRAFARRIADSYGADALHWQQPRGRCAAPPPPPRLPQLAPPEACLREMRQQRK